MPHKSSKQRGYLHAHPEITDKKGNASLITIHNAYYGK